MTQHFSAQRRVWTLALASTAATALLPTRLAWSQDVLAPAAVLATLERVADWQLANPSRHRPDDWTQAVGYTGFMALAGVSRNPAYRAAMVRMGESNGWKLGPNFYHADDHIVGQTYAELAMQLREPRMIAPMRAHFDSILANPRTGTLDFKVKGNQDRWSWCDALFMAPPAWLRLTAATGDERYAEFALREWWVTSDYLYDRQEHLYYRDSNAFDQREANGRKVFWGRGNGWVIGGLVRVLQYLPAAHPARPRFEQQYREMATRILALQQPDGLWRSSLLDPASYPMKESSGSALYTYALAWGVNNALLDRAAFEPAVRKAWTALAANVDPDGRLTHVQPIGLAPKVFDAQATEVYGVGAFLLAGSEVFRLAHR
ncbi:rhamnogalacturonyl hydrolase YesR [Pseudoduganella flava]|uniref:Glycoside hydrolase family 88 protein n=1 Tax=Pseudoduganella flava TaxID=871742 RepID=A0A562PWR9_9BURK|nr:glycoside hydrolase family 88 protein [Pseudoduganella flava]QGZ39939.1 glycoside hydrolase family 88 protein [Pseudoduganella flava]TWI48875.1 rhamnogalacturonyl hydrolase YesR [Pseudoduganella flava]